MSAQWQRHTAVAALLLGITQTVLADGVTIGGDLSINIDNFTFCTSQQNDGSGNPASRADLLCAFEASQIYIDPFGHSTSNSPSGANSMGSISAPSCRNRVSPRLRNRMFGTNVIGCKP